MTWSNESPKKALMSKISYFSSIKMASGEPVSFSNSLKIVLISSPKMNSSAEWVLLRLLKGKLMKTDDEKKVELLFKFFSTPPPSSQTHLPESTLAHNKNNISDRNSPCQNKGVKFNDFLLMVHIFLRKLYNYPKEDLKEILNDREFFEK